MKQITTFFLLCAFPILCFGQRFVAVDAPHDSAATRGTICKEIDQPTTDDSKLIKSLGEEYRQIIEIHFSSLEVQDIEKIFGPRIEEHRKDLSKLSTDVVLPLFEPMMIGLSGLMVTNDQSHRTLYSVGDLGCVEFFYHWDGKMIGGVIFYPRPDKEFVPLETINDISKRLQWDENKFTEFKRWIAEKMPPVFDLGVIEVSEAEPKRLTLGTNVCAITTREIHHPSVTNLWYEITIAKDGLDPRGRFQSGLRKSVVGVKQPVGFSFDGKFYEMTPKLVKS